MRITYWTGWLSPEMEGCSKEVFALKDHFARSRVFGLSRYYTFKASRRDRYFGLNVRLYPVFRALAPLWDATSDINHIYGSLAEWFFLRALTRRPLIMTIATATVPFEVSAYKHVHHFITHSNSTARKMITHWGFEPARISLIYPGVDLERFHPGPRAATFPLGRQRHPSRLRVLFATAPNWAEGVKLKGIDLIIDAARRLPDVDFFLFWRPWTGAARLVDDCRRRAPENVHISTELLADMPALFRAADAVIAPFVKKAGMKICPTSLVESLACGRPLLASTKVGFADLIEREGCGLVFAPTVPALCRAVTELQSNYPKYAVNARWTAEQHFDIVECHRRHEQLYRKVLQPC